MAIGRFPVAEPEEATAIVDKILRYATQVGVGPWRRDVLWLTGASKLMRRRSDTIAQAAAAHGFAPLKVYPTPDEGSDEHAQDPLMQAFDKGVLMVHFFGHGARYVWRTGATSHRNRFDLFTLEHLHKLSPTAKLPLVLSMTCWSAPFDHPTADSFGEKFLRLEGRGAVAFLGASWKVTPNKKLSNALIEELAQADTIGEAVLRAKRRLNGRSPVETYNLLGDPATELARPRHSLTLAASGGNGDGWQVVARMPEETFAGRGLVDWLDEAGEVVRSEELAVTGATLTAGYRPEGESDGVGAVRVYVWNEKLGVDGMGALELNPPPPRENG